MNYNQYNFNNPHPHTHFLSYYATGAVIIYGASEKCHPAYNPYIVAHDILHHINGVDKIGSIEDEIEAQREVDVQSQEADRIVGEKTADTEKQVGIAKEHSLQEIKSQQAVTKERDMEIIRVEEVKQAEITKDQEIVKAEETKETTIIVADGQLEEQKRSAEGIKVVGEAEAEAKKLMELAPIKAQIELAQEIGDNAGYQKYLVDIESINAAKLVGVEQAKALTDADLKVIANGGEITSGLNGLSDLFNPKGGVSLGGMVEAFKQTTSNDQVSKET